MTPLLVSTQQFASFQMTHSSTYNYFIRKRLLSLATNLAKSTIESKVKEETKKLEKLQKEKKSLVKNKESYEKNIKEAKESIQKNEKSIVENTEAQKSKAKEIAEQADIAEKIKAKLKKF